MMSPREDLIATSSARVAQITLQPREESPWHYHTELTEHVFCLQGTIHLEGRNPVRHMCLQTGDRCDVNALEEHRFVNATTTSSTYLLVQSGTYDFIPTESEP